MAAKGLRSAIEQYIENENAVNNTDQKEKELQAKYDETLKLKEDGFTIDDAEETYAAYQELKNHRSSKKHQDAMQEASAVIKDYLNTLDPKKILYSYQVPNNPPLTYVFSLDENDNVTHNRKNRPNNRGGK